MLEQMARFFEARLESYDSHMLENIAGAREFYPATAAQLPTTAQTRLLDLGCGTGLELGYYFPLCPTAKVTGIDLSQGMLTALAQKFQGKCLTLIHGSYFDVPFEKNGFDAAVSVESLHHFTAEEKLPLYRKVSEALAHGGSFILTDYFAADEAEETALRQEFLHLREGLPSGEFYHFDTPLTVQHETEVLEKAGFSVEVLQNWGATYMLKADKLI